VSRAQALRRRINSPRARTAARGAARVVGRASAPLRMTPSFLLVGGQRCGTTSLHRAIVEHPAVMPPLFHKGVNYFDLGYHHGPSWYRAHFPVASIARMRTKSTDAAPITGESSGYYLFHPLAAERIGRDLPGVRILALVRDPVERAYSAHKHEQMRGFEDEPFERALELEPERLAGEVERMTADPTYYSIHHRHHAYLARGDYATQLDRFATHCGRDNLLVVDAEDFFTDPETTYAEVMRFLDLPDFRPDTFEHANARPRAPMPDALRARLREHFAAADASLVDYLGRTPSWRRPQ
jgi:Sulfotransferase domain